MYPILLNLTGKNCLVVGGGAVAVRKVKALLEAGAAVTVVAQEIASELEHLVSAGKLDYRKESFDDDHIVGNVLVVAATNDELLNVRVAEAVRTRAVPVNVVDRPELCDFFVPAVVRRGPVTIAVSTEGRSPALAAYLRRKLDIDTPDYLGEAAELLGSLRKVLKSRVADARERGRLLAAVLEGGLLDRLAAGEKVDAEELAEEILRPEGDRR